MTTNPVERQEDAEALHKLANDYHVQLQPVGLIEIRLVDTLIDCDRKKARLTCIEDQVFEIKLAPHHDEPLFFGIAYIEDQNGSKLLPKLAREIAALDRLWFQSLKELDRIQKQRRKQEQERQETNAAAEVPKSEAASTTPIDPIQLVPKSDPEPDPLPALIALATDQSAASRTGVQYFTSKEGRPCKPHAEPLLGVSVRPPR